jgi:hypothetical protein
VAGKKGEVLSTWQRMGMLVAPSEKTIVKNLLGAIVERESSLI